MIRIAATPWPTVLVLVALIAAVLIWAVRSGQFEDLEGPAWRVLEDDDAPKRRESSCPLLRPSSVDTWPMRFCWKTA